jgi:hypothetical protein
LTLLPETFAICQLPPETPTPPWTTGTPVSITRTREELSIVCEEGNVPEGVRQQRGFRCLKVAGPLDFAMTGVIAALAGPLADAGISIFPLGTYDTDYLFIRQEEVRRAVAVLKGVGHRVDE